MKIKRIKSGVKNFDRLVQGGFFENSANILIGGAGTGKTTFSIQFLQEGLKKGEPCLYVTFEEKKENTYKEMKSLGIDLQKYEDKNKFFYLEYNSNQIRTLLEEGGGAIEEIINVHKIKRLVIDSISPVQKQFNDELTKQEANVAMYDLIKSWRCTTIMTALTMCESCGIPVASCGAPEYKADGVVYLYNIKIRGKRTRAIEVLKMRQTNHSQKTVRFDMTGKGLKISSRIIDF